MVLIMAVIASLNFFAVPLAAFNHMNPLQAIGIGLKAGLINWAALLMYALAVTLMLLGVGLVFLLISTLIAMLAGPSATAGGIITILMVPVFLGVQMILLCGQYLAYRDIFSPADSAPVAGQILA